MKMKKALSVLMWICRWVYGVIKALVILIAMIALIQYVASMLLPEYIISVKVAVILIGIVGVVESIRAAFDFVEIKKAMEQNRE